MKAIAIVPGSTGAKLVERQEPVINAPDEIKLKILQVGICGTDREEVNGGRARANESQGDLVIGHEMIGRVVETGKAVSRVKPDDYAVFTVRRGCDTCAACRMNRPDMCYSGQYRERGIWGLDGFQTEFVVDKEQYIVRIPEEIADIGVLTEPLSIAEKAIDESIHLQAARLPYLQTSDHWLSGRKCMVAGLGPIGLLASLALRLRGAEVYGVDIVEYNSGRPQWLTKIAGRYIDGRKAPPDRLDAMIGPMDFIFEATGSPGLAFNLMEGLALNGVYVLTGIPSGNHSLSVPGSELIRQLVLDNQVMLGSVNASRDHFQSAVDDLMRARLKWGDHVNKLITNRFRFESFAAALENHGQDEIKVIMEWQ